MPTEWGALVVQLGVSGVLLLVLFLIVRSNDLHTSAEVRQLEARIADTAARADRSEKREEAQNLAIDRLTDAVVDLGMQLKTTRSRSGA